MSDLPLMRTFYDELFHLTLDLPDGWRVGITDEFPLLLISPPLDGTPDANIGIARSVLAPPTEDGFNTLIDATKNDQPNVYQHYQHVYEINWLQDGYPAYMQRFDWHHAPDGPAFAQVMAMIWAGGDILYDIHGTTQQTTATDMIPVIEHIIRSIEFYADAL